MTDKEKVALIKTVLTNADRVEREIYPYILREIEEATSITPIEGTTYKGRMCVSEFALRFAQDYLAELCGVPYGEFKNIGSLIVDLMMNEPITVYNEEEDPIWEFTIRLHEDWRLKLEALIEILSEQN